MDIRILRLGAVDGERLNQNVHQLSQLQGLCGLSFLSRYLFTL